jgi:hypothetical protein
MRFVGDVINNKTKRRRYCIDDESIRKSGRAEY